ncbi:MAG: hypothetical protein LBL74_07270 [Bacteroidales bacterium]|jgi:hypothetical protein|nr:hypothetical protein [Bacteroidales bacterium]
MKRLGKMRFGNKKRSLVFGFMALCVMVSSAQSRQAMENFENQLKPLMDEMFYAPIDNQKFNANEKFIALMADILTYPKSFSYPFERLTSNNVDSMRISVLCPTDNRFRIYTWSIKNDFGEVENFGFVQVPNPEEKENFVYRLFDKSEESIYPEEAKLHDTNWFGAVYYSLITTKYDGNSYYTLLGWDGKDIYSQRKIIEPISIKASNGQPTFGSAVFYKEKNRKRCIFEYSPKANFILRYDNQFVERRLTKKTQRNKKIIPQSKTEIERDMMIVYDSLQSMFGDFESLPQYNIASYEFNGFKFEKGKWKRVVGVVPRNKPDKIRDKQNEDPNKSNIKKKSGLF